jgi:hypothetical protein
MATFSKMLQKIAEINSEPKNRKNKTNSRVSQDDAIKYTNAPQHKKPKRVIANAKK